MLLVWWPVAWDAWGVRVHADAFHIHPHHCLCGARILRMWLSRSAVLTLGEVPAQHAAGVLGMTQLRRSSPPISEPGQEGLDKERFGGLRSRRPLFPGSNHSSDPNEKQLKAVRKPKH